jgi:hypothetical protein
MAASFDRALERAHAWVGAIPGVVAVGEGRDEDGERRIDVWVTPDTTQGQVPGEVEGVAVHVRSSGGEISAQ